MATTTKTVTIRKVKSDGTVQESVKTTQSTTLGKIVKGTAIAGGALLILGLLSGKK